VWAVQNERSHWLVLLAVSDNNSCQKWVRVFLAPVTPRGVQRWSLFRVRVGQGSVLWGKSILIA